MYISIRAILVFQWGSGNISPIRHRNESPFWGNLDILKEKKAAFFCSSKCPGDLIIKTYDLAKKWRNEGITVIGGFHSPMEQECLSILLRGRQPVIVCPARSIETMRLKAEYRTPLAESRLLFLSAFPEKING